jgi:glyoxylase-like metal-dependent hydrolase (beta-lactamase superfamily II)
MTWFEFVNSDSGLSTSNESTASQKASTPKLPRPLTKSIFAFPPNRDTLGGTAYFVATASGNMLVDCPGWDDTNHAFLQAQGGVRWLFLTHRGGIGRVQEIQQAFECEVVIQEQEAYLLPGLTLRSFEQRLDFNSTMWAFWTPGHSPGSSCLYYADAGGILFSGRHLLPDQQGNPTPLRMAKTFHWPRQISNVKRILDQFTPETLQLICPGANIGLLRGQQAIAQAYQRLAQLDLEQLLQMKVTF